jgi:hypothetical protein
MTVAPRIEVVNIGCERNGGGLSSQPNRPTKSQALISGSLLSNVSGSLSSRIS